MSFFPIKIASFVITALIPMLLGYYLLRIAIRDGIKDAITQLKQDNII